MALHRSLSAITEAALGTLAARRAVLSLMLSWPPSVPCTLASLGGARNLLSLAKMIAGSENVFSYGTGLAAATPMMGVVKHRMREFLVQERAQGRGGGGGGGGDKLSAALVADCVSNLELSTRSGDSSEARLYESLHPQFGRCDYVGEAHFEGAKALFVTFDPQCHVDGGSLTFQSSKGGGATLARFTSADTFKPLVVHSDRVFFRFRTDAGSSTGSYGYRFEVSPMHGLQWLNEQARGPCGVSLCVPFVVP